MTKESQPPQEPKSYAHAIKLFNENNPSPPQKRPSKLPYVIVVLALLFLFAEGQIAKYHLKIEQSWSAELLDQNTHTLEIVGMQKKYINDLHKALQAQFEQLHPEASNQDEAI